MSAVDPEIKRDSDGINWAWEGHPTENVFYGSLMRTLLRQIPRGAVALEIGAGSGHALAELNRNHDCHSYGVDILPSAAAVARSRAVSVGATVRLVVGSGFALPFLDGVFDLVMSHGVIEHFPHDRARDMLREHARVCRPGGRVLVSVPNSLDVFHTLYRMSLGTRYPYWPERSYSPPALARELRAVGLVSVAADGYGPFWSLRHGRLLYPLGAALNKLGLLERLSAISNPRLLAWCANMIVQVGEKPRD